MHWNLDDTHIQTSVARRKLVHSSALGKKSPYSCQKLSLQSKAYKRRHANLKSESVCHKKVINIKKSQEILENQKENEKI